MRRGLRCLEQNGDVSVGQLGRSLWAMVAQMQMRLLRMTSHLWQMDLRSQRLLLFGGLSQSFWNPNCPRQSLLALRFLRFRRPWRRWWQRWTLWRRTMAGQGVQPRRPGQRAWLVAFMLASI